MPLRSRKRKSTTKRRNFSRRKSRMAKMNRYNYVNAYKQIFNRASEYGLIYNKLILHVIEKYYKKEINEAHYKSIRIIAGDFRRPNESDPSRHNKVMDYAIQLYEKGMLSEEDCQSFRHFMGNDEISYNKFILEVIKKYHNGEIDKARYEMIRSFAGDFKQPNESEPSRHNELLDYAIRLYENGMLPEEDWKSFRYFMGEHKSDPPIAASSQHGITQEYMDRAADAESYGRSKK